MGTSQFAELLKQPGLDKRSASPFYQQLKDLIIEAAREGTLQPTDRLPSERDLSATLGISRITVRHALKSLLASGWLVAKPGKGTFVRGPKIEQEIHQLMGLTEDMQRRGHTVVSRVLQAAPAPSTAGLIRVMGLGPEEDVVLLERLRLVDGEPLAIERSYLRHSLCPGILQYDLATTSLYRILRGRYGLNPYRAEQTYEAAPAGGTEAQLLGIAEGAPVLFLERTVFLDTGQVLEHGWAWYRGDKYRFHAILLDFPSGASNGAQPTVSIHEAPGGALVGDLTPRG